MQNELIEIFEVITLGFLQLKIGYFYAINAIGLILKCAYVYL